MTWCLANAVRAFQRRYGLTVDGVEPFRISTDPMRSAWPKLRAAGIPAGMGVS